MTDIKTYVSHSTEETIDIGYQIASYLKKGDCVLLYGDLGAGKTAITKGIASYFGFNKDNVISPTFTIVNQYPANVNIYHFDLYRLDSEDMLDDIGFDEYIYSDAISIIEWPECGGSRLPLNHIDVQIKYGEDMSSREITVKF
ncbi:MAG: tRNA (adenosine(37)-N6)-threonylcarbamoyltransferase complex ATPase subunit type 1 TsaE [Clostridiales bacterium]|nr:tRNA (adenosine(37)-N6)-threonylcarbamoyltransferase complex ATPase subunit type 1 TsaE [Clostridiales bacterium]